jgi:hypothetical protein
VQRADVGVSEADLALAAVLDERRCRWHRQPADL